MSELLDKIAAAQAAAKEAVEAERRSHADEITAAVAKARAAWEADDAAEHAAALAGLDSLIASLKQPALGFSPSAN